MNTRAAQHHERHSAEHARNVAELEMQWWNPPAQDEAIWNAPIVEDPPLTIEEMKARESRMHVDLVRDMVPFWIKGVEAAEKGEVLRLEHFLETLQEASDAWLHSTSETPRLQANSDRGWDQWDENWNKVDAWDSTPVDAWGTRPKSANGSRIRSESDSQLRRRGQTMKGGGRQRRKIESRRHGNTKRERESFASAFDFVEHVAKQQSADEDQKRRMHNFFDVCQIGHNRDSSFMNVF
jgi:hypothetical protein